MSSIKPEIVDEDFTKRYLTQFQRKNETGLIRTFYEMIKSIIVVSTTPLSIRLNFLSYFLEFHSQRSRVFTQS